MLLHSQRYAPTSGCFTPNPTRFPRALHVPRSLRLSELTPLLGSVWNGRERMLEERSLLIKGSFLKRKP
ncbi:conserved hypothetical protein [Ricinus communis]|uniref:Uncharacterized protein n=1 Tax=Ricinus communis TaxID=3988 RepID=B9SGA3_RICCO|nr:conserved hypothetical protein [Ricinus communis]